MGDTVLFGIQPEYELRVGPMTPETFSSQLPDNCYTLLCNDVSTSIPQLSDLQARFQVAEPPQHPLTRASTHTYTQTHIHAYTHAHMHTRKTHTHARTHTHAQIQTLFTHTLCGCGCRCGCMCGCRCGGRVSVWRRTYTKYGRREAD